MINKISLDLTKNIPTRPALIFGMENENNSSFLEIKLPYSLVDKWLYIEFSTSECEPFTTPRLTAQDIDGNAILVYEIDNPITQYLGFGKMQVVAKNASGLVWKSSIVDYIIKNSINATEQIVESKPDVIADLQRQINEIGGGGGSTPSGSNSSGIYVVTQDLALEGTSSTPLDSVLVGEKELQVGDILTDNKGTIAKVSSIEETTITSGGGIAVGDTFDTLYFNTEVEPNFDAFDWSIAKKYEKEGSIWNGYSYMPIFDSTDTSLVALMGDLDGKPVVGFVYGLEYEDASNGYPNAVYSNVMGGWRTKSYYVGEITIKRIFNKDIWNSYISNKQGEFGGDVVVDTIVVVNYEVVSNQEIPQDLLNKGDENAFTSLASGQPIEKIVFNPNVSVEKMTNYLAGLTYDETIQGVPSVCKLVGIDFPTGTISVYAMDFSALNVVVPNTSGYGIGVIDTAGDGFVLKQGIFATEYNEANATLINAIKDPNYVLNYTKAGWSDTNDYVLDTSTTHTIYSVLDNKVSAFIGRDSRFFEVVEMLDNGTELKKFEIDLRPNTKANLIRLRNIIYNSKGNVKICDSVTNFTFHCYPPSRGDDTLSITLKKESVAVVATMTWYEIRWATTQSRIYCRYRHITLNDDGSFTLTTTNDEYSVPTLYITYYNDVEITA